MLQLHLHPVAIHPSIRRATPGKEAEFSYSIVLIQKAINWDIHKSISIKLCAWAVLPATIGNRLLLIIPCCCCGNHGHMCVNCSWIEPTTIGCYHHQLLQLATDNLSLNSWNPSFTVVVAACLFPLHLAGCAKAQEISLYWLAVCGGSAAAAVYPIKFMDHRPVSSSPTERPQNAIVLKAQTNLWPWEVHRRINLFLISISTEGISLPLSFNSSCSHISSKNPRLFFSWHAKILIRRN